ncbi:HAD-IA family hydrolase [Sporichthya brevicatena]|uniref:HAD-IA family hydrolase n=1 Tax=Sporichthya brevicatena TaxID=171442 RepID=A0ABN1GRY4_9ACTN
MTVTAVAFDFGGVLTYSAFAGFNTYEAELGLPADALVTFFRDDPKMGLLETGQLTSREFMKYVCIEAERRHGQRIDMKRLGAAAGEGQVLNPAMLAFVEEVREHATTALLTNNVAEAAWRATFPFELFEVVVDSSEAGVRKPDPQIYRVLLDKLDRPAAEVAFVDDLAVNVDGAATVGIHPILFTGLDTCRAELVRLGALPAPQPA